MPPEIVKFPETGFAKLPGGNAVVMREFGLAKPLAVERYYYTGSSPGSYLVVREER